MTIGGLRKVSLTSEDELVLMLAELSDKPYDFVLWAFPWAELNTDLEDREGPEPWQNKVLKDLQANLISFDKALRIAIRSGHGVGKSTLLSWLALWALSTREDTRGRITANTEKQLRTILWGEIAKWFRLFIAKDLFRMEATALFSADVSRKQTWRLDCIPWSEDNPEAFAGLHNFGKRIFVIYDEGSGIADNIWETTEGAMTDANTQIIWIVASNPTRSEGKFRECFFDDRYAGDWLTYQVDAREVSFSNKIQIAAWEAAYGEDDDFFRVRVRGEFPNASTLQLIPTDIVLRAMRAEVQSFHFEPLVLSVDVARFGNNETVAQFRRGRDARTMPVRRWRGKPVTETADLIANMIHEFHPDAVFVDEGGVGGGVVDCLHRLHHMVTPVNFGAAAGGRPGGVLVGNKRSEMWVALREWMREGGCIAPNDDLRDQLIAMEYHYNKKQEIMLISKEDLRAIGKPSPDWGDALALSFAFPVSSRLARVPGRGMVSDYDPLSEAALPGHSPESVMVH